MKDIIILEQCKICGRHLILRESGCCKGDRYKAYIVKYCSNNCMPVEEIVEIEDVEV